MLFVSKLFETEHYELLTVWCMVIHIYFVFVYLFKKTILINCTTRFDALYHIALLSKRFYQLYVSYKCITGISMCI